MATITKSDIEESRDWLRSVLKPGMTVYTVLRHVSRSGMQRQIDCYIMSDNKPLWITGRVANVCGMSRADNGHGPIKINGCGMDMGFAIVYDLSRTIFTDGFNRESRTGILEEYVPDGGYALNHSWL